MPAVYTDLDVWKNKPSYFSKVPHFKDLADNRKSTMKLSTSYTKGNPPQTREMAGAVINEPAAHAQGAVPSATNVIGHFRLLAQPLPKWVSIPSDEVHLSPDPSAATSLSYA